MSIWEIIGTLLGVIGVGLMIRQQLWGWPVGLLQVAIYAWVFYAAKLYSDAILQVLFFCPADLWLVALGAAGRTGLVLAGSTASDAVKPHGARRLGGRGRRPDRRLGVGHASPDGCDSAVVGRLHLNF